MSNSIMHKELKPRVRIKPCPLYFYFSEWIKSLEISTKSYYDYKV